MVKQLTKWLLCQLRWTWHQESQEELLVRIILALIKRKQIPTQILSGLWPQVKMCWAYSKGISLNLVDFHQCHRIITHKRWGLLSQATSCLLLTPQNLKNKNLRIGKIIQKHKISYKYLRNPLRLLMIKMEKILKRTRHHSSCQRNPIKYRKAKDKKRGKWAWKISKTWLLMTRIRRCFQKLLSKTRKILNKFKMRLNRSKKCKAKMLQRNSTLTMRKILKMSCRTKW